MQFYFPSTTIFNLCFSRLQQMSVVVYVENYSHVFRQLNNNKYQHPMQIHLYVCLIFPQHFNVTFILFQTKSSNTSASSDVIALDETSPKQTASVGTRKRSHSKSDSDTSENTNDVSKKSKYIYMSGFCRNLSQDRMQLDRSRLD